jgi:hypothetical protein
MIYLPERSNLHTVYGNLAIRVKLLIELQVRMLSLKGYCDFLVLPRRQLEGQRLSLDEIRRDAHSMRTCGEEDRLTVTSVANSLVTDEDVGWIVRGNPQHAWSNRLCHWGW